MNLTQEQLEIDAKYDEFVPFKTVVVAYLLEEKDEKISKNEWFKSLYTGRTTRGLLLIPFNNSEFCGNQVSDNSLCAQFFAYPQYTKTPVYYRALKN